MDLMASCPILASAIRRYGMEEPPELTVEEAIAMLPDGLVMVCRQYGDLLLTWKWPKERVAEIFSGKGVEWSNTDATVAGYQLCCEYGPSLLFVSTKP